jgi:nucleotide-binding universal stress UspA family protein
VPIFHKILIPVGPGESDAELISYAETVAALAGSTECRFVHVLGWPAKAQTGQSPQTHAQALASLQALVERTFHGSGANCAVLHGNLIDQVLETAVETQADLILVGHRSGQNQRRALARRLAMKAPCSVWMHPNGGPAGIRRILAAIDFSTHAAQALSTATALAQHIPNAECSALHVYFDESLAGPEDQPAIRQRAQSELESFLAPLDTHGIKVRAVVEDSPSVTHAVERLAEREGVDLAVMGSRGQSRSLAILLGSESDHLLMEAQVPVLVVKKRGERIGLLQALLDREFHLPASPQFG